MFQTSDIELLSPKIELNINLIKSRKRDDTVKPFNLAALNFSVLPFVDILAAL